MLVTLAGIEMSVSSAQRENAPNPMPVRPGCRVTLESLVHPSNVPTGRVPILPGMVMVVRPEHSRNSWVPTLVTLEGMMTSRSAVL